MSTQDTQTPDGRESDRGRGDGAGRLARLVSTATRFGRNGGAALAVAVLLLGTVRRSRSRWTAAAKTLVGAGLFALGLRQWRAARSPVPDEGAERGSGDAEPDDEEKVSADAHAALERHDVMHQNERNPRGTTGEPDVEPSADPDEGEVQFTDEHGEAHSEPHLDDGPEDPRYHDEEDDTVEVDLSEAAMADEASEATGPSPEQAQPALTEDTEPESSPPGDASHSEADVPETDEEPDADDGADPESADADEPADEGGATTGGTADEDQDGDEDERQDGDDTA